MYIAYAVFKSNKIDENSYSNLTYSTISNTVVVKDIYIT